MERCVDEFFSGHVVFEVLEDAGEETSGLEWRESEAVQLGVISLAMVVELVGRDEFTKGKSMERECFPFFSSFI